MAEPSPVAAPRSRRAPDLYEALLLGLMALYVLVFTSLAFGEHAGLRTHRSDLGQIDQAVWNSSRGRFVENTDTGELATRLTDHVEPILALISPILWVWDDGRALLLLQAVALAAGAWPLYHLARRQLEALVPEDARDKPWRWEPVVALTRPLALALAVAYLLAPQLHAAALTEFHAVPLAVPLLLWAFWAVAARRVVQFVIAATLVALVKEETALLAAGLGVWALWRWGLVEPQPAARHRDLLAAGVVTLAALAWFYVATFIIVPAHAVALYGDAASAYFRRYGALGDTPADILKSFFTQPQVVWAILAEPPRTAYLVGLAAAFGFLALLAPEIVLLGAPVLLANVLSAYPAQYYGDFHYSAPVVVYFAASAAYGTARLWRWLARRTDTASGHFVHLPAARMATMQMAGAARNARAGLRPLLTAALIIWILAWAGYGYLAQGRGPLGARYDPASISAHDRLLARFLTQIPADAPLTATAALHPHVSHRRYIYQFPLGLESSVPAEWALLDVTTATDMAPGDLKTTVEQMLAADWGVVDAADGYLLLHKGAPEKTIPDAFYDFARGPAPAESVDTSAAPLTWAGLEVEDWRRWRQTQLTSNWQVGAGFDGATMRPELILRTPAGETLYQYADAMPPALVWYPPERWQPGETVRITTLPLYLPAAWGALAGTTPGSAVPAEAAIAADDAGTLVAAYTRGLDGKLTRLPDNLAAARQALMGDGEATANAEFRIGDREEPVVLRGRLPRTRIWPGALVDLLLDWGAEGGWPEGYTAFVHLRRDGENVTQEDGLPRYFVRYPVESQAGSWLDWRQLAVPEDAAPGKWQVVVGLYDAATGARAPLTDGSGNEVVLGELEFGTPPPPDQACALIPAACE